MRASLCPTQNLYKHRLVLHHRCVLLVVILFTDAILSKAEDLGVSLYTKTEFIRVFAH